MSRRVDGIEHFQLAPRVFSEDTQREFFAGLLVVHRLDSHQGDGLLALGIAEAFVDVIEVEHGAAGREEGFLGTRRVFLLEQVEAVGRDLLAAPEELVVVDEALCRSRA
jgi:hypothetical protein